MKIKSKSWEGHEIRFVEVEPGDWWAVAKDVAVAIGYGHTPHLTRRIDTDEKADVRLKDSRSENGVTQARKVTIISEIGIYEAIFGSELEQAKTFKKWVYSMLKELRQVSGLEGFQMFKMMDLSHQKEMMDLLKETTQSNKPLNYIKANAIANKAVSTKYGHPKMVKKGDMTPEMLRDRQYILEDTVRLMGTVNEFGLEVSISEKIYEKHIH